MSTLSQLVTSVKVRLVLCAIIMMVRGPSTAAGSRYRSSMAN